MNEWKKGFKRKMFWGLKMLEKFFLSVLLENSNITQQLSALKRIELYIFWSKHKLCHELHRENIIIIFFLPTMWWFKNCFCPFQMQNHKVTKLPKWGHFNSSSDGWQKYHHILFSSYIKFYFFSCFFETFICVHMIVKEE